MSRIDNFVSPPTEAKKLKLVTNRTHKKYDPPLLFVR